MDLTFRPIAESYREVKTEVIPDGSIEKETATKVPAWVSAHIRKCFNGFYYDVGRIEHETITTTPP